MRSYNDKRNSKLLTPVVSLLCDNGINVLSVNSGNSFSSSNKISLANVVFENNKGNNSMLKFLCNLKSNSRNNRYFVESCKDGNNRLVFCIPPFDTDSLYKCVNSFCRELSNVH